MVPSLVDQRIKRHLGTTAELAVAIVGGSRRLLCGGAVAVNAAVRLELESATS
jgi:hypothetical protein